MTWHEEALQLWKKLDDSLDGGRQIKIIAEQLRFTYEQGVGDGIKMEAGMRARNDQKTD